MPAHGDDLMDIGSIGTIRVWRLDGYGNAPPQPSQLFVDNVSQTPAAQGFFYGKRCHLRPPARTLPP
jgi:hypothetical protein